MYELIQVSEQSYYIQSPAKIGLVRLNGQHRPFLSGVAEGYWQIERSV